MSYQPPHGYPPPGGYGPPPGYGAGYGPPVGVWVCRHCNAPGEPLIRWKISTGGWIMFAVLLLVCFPLCWIGLTMKESLKVCRKCFTPAGGAL
jgi:hypothetical protein